MAEALDLDAAGAEVVRDASRHVIRFPASRVRTFAVPAPDEGPRAEAQLAAVLAEADVPATRCVGGPEPVEGWIVTAWREIDGVDPASPLVGASTLGRLAGDLHRSTASVSPELVSECDPLGAARAQLDRAGERARRHADALRGACDRLEPLWWTAVDDDGEDATIVHGDLHRGNVVDGADGPVLVDLELSGWGPRAFDAAPTVAFVRWYGCPETDEADFDAAYGTGLTVLARSQGLDQVWAAWSACWAVANAHRSAGAAEEAEVRATTVVTGHAPRPWRLG